KEALVRYVIIDRKGRTLLTDSFTTQESKTFSLIENLNEQDRYSAEHQAEANTVEEIVEFEKHAMTIPFTRILDHAVKMAAKRRPLPKKLPSAATLLTRAGSGR
ncbi:MAG: hypothetical protein HQL50_15880, partial [Magnetococcales bacterium]|nr:hypothetical protein [Magnetococcales bacterium]